MAKTVAASTPLAARARPGVSGFLDGPPAAAVRRSVTSVPKRRGWLVRRMLVLADLVGLTTAFALAEILVRADHRTGSWSGTAELLLFVVMLPLWIGFAQLQGLLAEYGYPVNPSGFYGDETRDVVAAFQRHFRPARVDGIADGSTLDTLERLVIARRALLSRARMQARAT